MALIIWKNTMSVGVDVLDADAIIVASLINHIDDAKQSGTDERAIGRILRVLVDHAFRHFAREQRLLEAHGYPRLEEHKREHRLVEEQLQELHDAYERTPDRRSAGRSWKFCILAGPAHHESGYALQVIS